MKNPNGYGSVFKLSGKRRKPFCARITVGWEVDNKTEKAKQKYKTIGYFETRPEAMIALAEYNKNPYDIDNKKVTFEEVFQLWKKEKYSSFSDSNIRGYNAAYALSDTLHAIPFKDIKKAHMQAVISGLDKSYSMKKRIKTLYNQLFKFALQNDIVEKDYSKFIELGKDETNSDREPFSDVEIKKLWDNIEKAENADMALIMIYTGMRPSELLEVESNNINLNERYLVGGIKTEAGKDRIIPINKKILPLIEKRMDSNKKYLVRNSLGDKMTYNSFRKDYWVPLTTSLKLNHKAHDCRHTFATLMDNAGANKVAVKKIMGHASRDITEKVYTHKNIEELIKAIDLI
ncbi:site-specific integrase [Virgibacillus sp. AGTR]|uniref:tyrosine-type recombinase/integrase n=1 Tax=Virgibacillus sp. AGTR TaxID=2812055 RepID=UPI001D16CEC8|nr:site-specific integrase [Virgibacillus sp. AGTR]MCC2249116.1 site-specific integrase [Virgibacillus sp. AGTR]